MKKTSIILGALCLLFWLITSIACTKNVNARKIPMDLIFIYGSNPEELKNFSTDIQKVYPEVELTSVQTDNDAFESAVRFHNIPPEEIAEYRKTLESPLVGLPTASIKIRASVKELGTEREFKRFVATEFSKYASLKLREDSGGGGDRIANFFTGRDLNKGMCISPLYSIKLLIGRYLYH